jgi:hypothetical protein
VRKQLIVLVAILVTVGFGQGAVRALFTDDGLPSVTALDGDVTKPASASLLKKYDIRVPRGTPAYVVASGRAEDHPWFAVAYQTPGGQACFALRGYNRAGECRRLTPDRPEVEQLGGSSLGQLFVNYGFAHVRVHEVVFVTDTGYSWSTPAVRPGDADFRFFAVTAKHNRRFEVRSAERRGVLDRNPKPTSPEVVLCQAAESPLFGFPDALPRAGSTTLTHVMDVRSASGEQLLQKYGATAVLAEPRNGAVWRPTSAAPQVVEAADFLLRLYLPSASQCPSSPQVADGVPLSFAVGPEPAAKNVAVAKR